MKSRFFAFLAAALLAPLNGGAASLNLIGAAGGNYSVRVSSLLENRFRSTVRQQFDFSCGSAAVATLLTYQYGYPMSEQTAFEQMFARGDQAKIRREGFSLLDIKRLLQSHGFEADGFEAPLKALEDARLPAIALIAEHGYKHFVVLKGLRQGRVLLSDPSVGERVLPQARFEELWQHRLLFVIHNRQQSARFNSAESWRRAPLAPLQAGIPRGELVPAVRLGPGEF